MKTIAAVVSILVILGASLGSCRILSERSSPRQLSSPLPVAPPRRVYPSPGIGSPEPVAMEEKTLGYLNWARHSRAFSPTG